MQFARAVATASFNFSVLRNVLKEASSKGGGLPRFSLFIFSFKSGTTSKGGGLLSFQLPN